MHLCNLARCQHSKGIVFINFEGEISWMTILFFLVDANMQASQNYGTTTGTAARVLRPSTEYQWSLLALPAPKIFTIIKIMFFPGPVCTFSAPPQSVSLLTNARSGPRRAGSAKCTSCANKFRKHIQAITISIATRKWSISSPSYSREWLQKLQLLQQKNERRPSWLFCIFLFCDHKFASCANTSWENTAALCVNPNPLVNTPSVHKLVFGKTNTCVCQVIALECVGMYYCRIGDLDN